MSDDLFSGRGLSRRADPDTSKEAALKVDATGLQLAVWKDLCANGPATTREISARTGIPLWSLSPRMRPLADKGLVRETYEKRNNQIVWQALEKI